MTPAYFFSLGQPDGTLHSRYAIVAADGHTVLGVQVSVPDLVEIDRPAQLRSRQSQIQDVQIKRFRINETPSAHNGEQPRRAVWRRAGKRAAAETAQ